MKEKRLLLQLLFALHVIIREGTKGHLNGIKSKKGQTEYAEAKLWIKALHNKYVSRMLTSSKLFDDADGNRRRVIKYGSKWCGRYFEAKERSKVPQNMADLDDCCNQHDDCPLIVHNNEQRWGFQNIVGFTLNDCNCDDKFYECLKKIEGIEGYAAAAVGKEYFDVLKTPCLVIPQQKIPPTKVNNSYPPIATSEDIYPGVVTDAAEIRKPKKFETKLTNKVL